ncbi:MAG: hypothetical protein GY694_13445 [Gammaproteobacteria bacterium]|nr:hypothetical protein [Gammaproteobacteria bacterium]
MKLFTFFIFVFFTGNTFSTPLSQSNEAKHSDFWSPLTETELFVINNHHLAKKGDADALLGLAIFASGDIRNQSDYSQIIETVHQFVIKVKPLIDAEADDWSKGLKLFLLMHESFFLKNTSANPLAAYQYNQSQFSALFKNKTYNCISSSLLYIILARYFDLSVQGVILPSHSFVQLKLPNGQFIEIETTSQTGYALHHSKEFYDNNAFQWSQNRNLSPSTFNDYINRKIVTPYELIIENMNNQHTAPEHLEETDRGRLFELRAYLSPTNIEAQLYRLYFFNNKLIQLNKIKDKNRSLSLIQTIERTITADYEHMFDDDLKQKKNAHQIIAFVYALKTQILLDKEQTEDALSSSKKALRWTRYALKRQNIIDNIAITWLSYANTFFSKKDYQSAIKFYDQAYISGINKELKSKIDANIAASYWNLSIPLLNKGNSLAAYKQLNQCLETHPHIEACKEKLQTICSKYSLPTCQSL